MSSSSSSSLWDLCNHDDRVRLGCLLNLFCDSPSKRITKKHRSVLISNIKLRTILSDYLSNDLNPTIRQTSWQILHDNWDDLVTSQEITFVKKLYNQLQSFLNIEEDEKVRLVLVQLAFLLSKKYPLIRVTFTGHQSSVKFQDVILPVAVAYILAPCIGEPAVEIRRQCCQFLGEIPLEDRLLEALLSKTPIPNVPWSYCGSFVIALEDEYQSVRLAAVHSIGKIATRSHLFAIKCLDSLVDCFQDEVERVKIVAMRNLGKIYQQYRMPSLISHFEAILAHLDDTQNTSRQAIRQVFAQTVLPEESDLLPKMIRCLQLAINKYRAEETDYMLSLRSFALGNSKHIMAQSGRLLKVDKFFLMTESKIEDLSNQIRLLLVLNALSLHPEMVDYVPDTAIRRYHYLRLRYPGGLVEYRRGPLQRIFFVRTLDEHLEAIQDKILQRMGDYITTKETIKDDDSTIMSMNLRYNAANFTADFIEFCLELLKRSSSEWKQLLLTYYDPSNILRPFFYEANTQPSKPLPYSPTLQRIRGELRVYGLGSHETNPIIIRKAEESLDVRLQIILNVIPTKICPRLRIFHPKSVYEQCLVLEDVFFSIDLSLDENFIKTLPIKPTVLVAELMFESDDGLDAAVIATTSIYVDHQHHHHHRLE